MPKQMQKQKDENLIQVGKMVQHYRLEKGNMTQEALAAAIHSNATYISKIETGSAEGLSIKMLHKLADSLDVSVADLVDVGIIQTGIKNSSAVKRIASQLHSLNTRAA